MGVPAIEDVVDVLSQRLGGARVAVALGEAAGRRQVAASGGLAASATDSPHEDLAVTSVPVHGSDGTVIGALETWVDVVPGSAAWHTLVVGASLAAAAIEEPPPWLARRAATAGLVVVGTDGALHAVSATVAAMIGRMPTELVGLPVFDLVHADDHAAAVESLARTAAFPGEKFPLDLRFLRADGGAVLLEVTATYRDDPTVEDLVFVVCEPSARHDADAFVAAQAQVLASIGRGAPLDETLRQIVQLLDRQLGRPAVAVLDDEGVLRVRAASGIPARAHAALDGAVVGPAGITPAVVVHRGQADRCIDLRRDGAWATLPGTAALAEEGLIACWAVPVASSSASLPMGAIAMFDRHGSTPPPEEVRIADLCAGLASVAVERARAEAVLARQATHDALTGLPNRACFLTRLDATLHGMRDGGGEEVAVMFLDLDRFKVINDALGHATGDELLIAIADRLCSAAAQTSMVARFGGDEFTVLCERFGTAEDVMALAQRFIDALREPLPLAGTEVQMTASIGVALADADLADAGALLRDADAAMYRAKAQGRNRVALFDDELRSHAVARLDLEHALAGSVGRGDFALVFQPEFELRTGRVVGTEALLRWRHPVRGDLRPADFISVAEETGAIIELGDWVFEQACRQAVTYLDTWGGSGILDPAFTMWVNVSSVQLLQSDFPHRVARAIATTRISPTRMGIEITESALIGDSSAAIAALEAVKALGIGIAIDDFGTGYSSLSYLAQLPVDVVKIDRSFVERIGVDERGTSVVGGITRLAHTVGCRVIAEGVETMHQLSALRLLGCDDAQGFVLARPQPASAPLHIATLPGR